MESQPLSTIGRPLDFEYPTNRAIGLLSLLVIAAGSVFRLATGLPLLFSLGWGLSAGITVFLAWAVTRELDPDRELAAFVSAGLALIGVFWGGRANLALAFWALLALRMVNHTTGLSATVGDSLGLIGLGGWLTYRGNWGLGLIAVVVFLVDAYLPRGKNRQWALAGLSALVGLLARGLGNQIWPAENLPWPHLLGAAAFTGIFLLVILDTDSVKSTCDRTSEIMQPVRIQAGQVLTLIIVVEYLIWQGSPGLWGALPLSAALLGAVLYRIYEMGFEAG